MNAEDDTADAGIRSASLRWKFVMIIMLVTGLGLVVMASGLLFNNHQLFKRSLLQNMSVMADVIGNNSKAALAFSDDKEASEILSALSADGHVIAGALYDGQGNLFSRYWRNDLAASLPRRIAMRDSEAIDGRHATVVRTIKLNDQVIGTILLRTDTGQWDSILRAFLSGLAALLLLTLALVFALSMRLQRLITEPISHLADIAKRISRHRNYGLRARKFTNDEVGVLVDGFNDMLEEIQDRHNELTATQHELQDRVQELNREVAERRNAEAAMRDSEARYRVLFENNPLPMWVCDSDSRVFVAANDAAIQHYGYTRDEFLSMTVDDLHVATDAPETRPSGKRAGGAARATPVMRHRRRDGTIIDVEIVSHTVQLAGRKSEIMLANDVTDRLRAECALQSYSDRLRVLNQLDRIISSSLNIHEIYAAFVHGLRQLLSFDRTAVLVMEESRDHMTLIDQWPETGTDPAAGTRIPLCDGIYGRLVEGRQPILQYRPGEHTAPVESPPLAQANAASGVFLPLVVKNQVIGALTIGSSKANVYRSEDLEILVPLADQMAIALRNAQLYEQVQNSAAELERRVAERTSQLEAANRELEAFSYSVSHDLRAPLRAMDGFSAALLTHYADRLDDQATNYLQRIRAASQRMGLLIDDLLKLSRVTRSEIARTELNLSRAAQSVIEELRSRDPHRGVEVSITADLVVTADANLITIVLENLLGNAWKFTQKTAAARIEVGTQAIDGARAYYIRDNGSGFDMAYANKLFGAFQRLHSDKDFEGNGIGLATVQRIIHLHGGRIWAEAEIDRGATFYFTLG